MDWILIHTCIIHVLSHSFNYKGCFIQEVEIAVFSHTPFDIFVKTSHLCASRFYGVPFP